MYHASRWLHDSRFYSPMAILQNGTHAFINDCVTYYHPDFDVVTCCIIKYFMKVGLYTQVNLGEEG